MKDVRNSSFRLHPSAFVRRHLLGLTVFLNGAVILGLEILGSRLMAPVFGNTLFVWGALIGVTLGGLSLGYYLGGRLASPARVLRLALAAGGAATLLAGPLRGLGPPLLFGLGTRWGPLAMALLLFTLPMVFLGMVLPLVARQRVREADQVGRGVGELFALATLGSLAGAFGMAFLFIPAFGVDLLLAGLGGTSLLLAVAHGGARAALPAALALLLLLALPREPVAGTLDLQNSAYAEVRVVERDGVRTLLLDGSIQGSRRLDGGPVSPYLQRLPEALWMAPAAKRALFLGLGTGGAPHLFRQAGLQVEAVEIDPRVAEVHTRFFLRGGEFPVHLEDARAFLRTRNERWDVIVVDLYAGGSVPVHLTTREFVAELRSRLSPGGVVAANLIGGPDGELSGFWRAQAATFAAEFPVVGVRPLTPDLPGNILLLAGAETALPPGYKPPPEGGRVLTDAYAPVETLQAPAAEFVLMLGQQWLRGGPEPLLIL